MKKVIVFGGGTGLSCLLSGLKLFPVEVTTVITVSDNGPGLVPNRDASDFHIGLQNVRDRLQMMSGGSLEFQSTPSVGTTVTVRIPPASD